MARRSSTLTLDGLPNLGPKSVALLRAAGVDSIATLQRMGTLAAFCAARELSPRVSKNLLWAIDAALAGLTWQQVAREHRTSLLLALEAYERERGITAPDPGPASPARPAPPRRPAPAPRPATPKPVPGAPAAGNSGTPLAGKLGLKPGMRVHARRWPVGFQALLGPLPPGLQIDAPLAPEADLVHTFTLWRAELEDDLRQARSLVRPDVPVWVSWPKKSAKRDGDVNEDVVRAVALPLGFVDVKVCAIDEVWSGLKLVVRRELR